jgi:hypothetical protein
MSVSVFPIADMVSVAGDSSQAQYLVKYLQKIGCNTVVQEPDYIDKDYIVDYSKYYARSFQDHPRKVDRLHFFANAFDLSGFVKALDANSIMEVCGTYLGFCTVKPIKDINGKKLIGRTLLATYQSYNGKARHYIAFEYESSLFGHPLRIYSLPFQAQDSQVGACATVALWSASHGLRQLYGTKINSPSEITEKATSFPSRARSFPSYRGLILEQMIGYIHSLELDKEIINISDEYDHAPASIDNIRASRILVKALVEAKIPVIATLSIMDANQDSTKPDIMYGKHAVVITGYGIRDGETKIDLFIHDDQIGPYCCTEWKEDTCELVNEWITERGHKRLLLENLIIPLYPKIRVSLNNLISWFLEFEDALKKNRFDSSLHIHTVKEYKSEIIARNDVLNKNEILISPMPRFLIIIRVINDNKRAADFIFDATETFPDFNNPISTTKYCS